MKLSGPVHDLTHVRRGFPSTLSLDICGHDTPYLHTVEAMGAISIHDTPTTSRADVMTHSKPGETVATLQTVLGVMLAAKVAATGRKRAAPACRRQAVTASCKTWQELPSANEVPVSRTNMSRWSFVLFMLSVSGSHGCLLLSTAHPDQLTGLADIRRNRVSRVPFTVRAHCLRRRSAKALDRFLAHRQITAERM